MAAIEAGAGKWRMPWHSGMDGLAPVLPVNVATGWPYRGVNTVVLWASAQKRAYGSAVWGTYRQWQERGAQVRKGAGTITDDVYDPLGARLQLHQY